MAYIIKTTGEVIESSPKNKVEFTLKELRDAIGGGYIELVRPVMDFNEMKHLDSTLVIDDSGAINNSEFNQIASFVAGQYIYGDTILISNTQIS